MQSHEIFNTNDTIDIKHLNYIYQIFSNPFRQRTIIYYSFLFYSYLFIQTINIFNRSCYKQNQTALFYTI